MWCAQTWTLARLTTRTTQTATAFAGNMLELRNAGGSRLIALSQQAYDALDEEQRTALHANGEVIPVEIPVIEASAGGSVRCMLAEIHLPTANAL